MKLKTTKLFLALTLITFTFSNCNKDEETTGDLEVYVEDVTGSAIVNETVYLYNNEADFNNVIFSDSKTTDNSGRVIFLNLDPGVYYVDCDFDNQAGGVTTITGSGSVSAGFETSITVSP